MRKLEYDPNSVLYRHKYKDDGGCFILVGSDPELADPTKLFRWLDEPVGWEKRELWSQGVTELIPVVNPVGGRSGWPGAIPLAPRPPGRPRKDLPVEDQIVKVSASLRRAELFEIMRLAADSRQSVAEWVAATLRERLEHAEKPASS